MNGVQFYRDQDLPYEMKVSDTTGDLAYKKHAHEEYSLGNEVNKLIAILMSPVSFLEKEASLLSLFEQMVRDLDKREQLSRRKLQPKLKTIKEYLHNCFLEKITLDQLEQVSGLNKYFIIRSFKEEFNVPPHTYQTVLRINYAKKELRRYRPITEVVYESGFYDQSHFNKVFKNYVGVTPDRYQKLI